jgi:hypothetical protein
MELTEDRQEKWLVAETLQPRFGWYDYEPAK